MISSATRVLRIISVISRHIKRRWIKYTVSLLFFLLVGISFVVFFLPPLEFPRGVFVDIPNGYTAKQAGAILQKKHVIIFPRLFRLLVRTSGNATGVKAGVYSFNQPAGLVAVTRRLLEGEFGIAPVTILFKQGMTVRQMSALLDKRLPSITSYNFQKVAMQYQGYLFPDTYTFPPNATADTIVSVMRKNFDIHIASIAPDIRASGYSVKEIVTIASLLEREGRTLKEKRMIAGILRHRLRIGMPLQVDAVFSYIFNKPPYSPTLADLKVKSPYNTYTHKGLPPGPIDNPSLESLLAAATPTKTNYLYYLTGVDGKMHYSKTLIGHNRNIVRYLRR